MKAEEAQALAEVEILKLSTIDNLIFNKLMNDVNKPSYLNTYVNYSKPVYTTHSAIPQTIIKQDNNGIFTNIKTNTDIDTKQLNADYDEQNNRWNIQQNKYVTFTENVLDGGSFSISFCVNNRTHNRHYMGYIWFHTDPTLFTNTDILIQRYWN